MYAIRYKVGDIVCLKDDSFAKANPWKVVSIIIRGDDSGLPEEKRILYNLIAVDNSAGWAACNDDMYGLDEV